MSGASSMRNAVKRVTHKERAQPAARKKFGLLEKHKDYVVRAKDYKKKKGIIKQLRQKALDRNPDEFYYKMNSSRVNSQGIHRDVIDNSMDNDTVQLLKSQDMGYIVHKKSVDARKIEKLRNSLHLIGAKPVKNHTLFVDDAETLNNFDVAKHFDAPEEIVHSTPHNRLKTSQVEAIVNNNIAMAATGQNRHSEVIREQNQRAMELSYRELYERSKRAKKLNHVMEKLQLQRNLVHSKGTKTRIVKRLDGTVIPASELKAADEARRISEENLRVNAKDSSGFNKRRRKPENREQTVVYKWKRQRSK